MNLAAVAHALLFLLPFLGALAVLALAARFTVYRRPPCSLQDVAFFVRQVDVVELAALLDPQVPRKLRETLSDEAYRRELDVHIRVVSEYIIRVNHNVRVIQSWVAGEYSRMEGKDPKEYSSYDKLVVEALQTAMELRIYAVAAQVKLRVWGILRVDRWPTQILPSVPNLRTLSGVNLLVNYRRLTEITRTLSRNPRNGNLDLCEVL
jgi:hypothetical protein